MAIMLIITEIFQGVTCMNINYDPSVKYILLSINLQLYNSYCILIWI